MDKKTPRALLKFDIGRMIVTVERRRETSVANETPLFAIFLFYLAARRETVLDGQFNWGGFLQKCNGGVQWSPYSV